MSNDPNQLQLIKTVEETSLDELFHRSKSLRTSKNFIELINFIKKFRNYSPFNNMLVYCQNPKVTYFATASHWIKQFKRHVKDDARTMVILAPMSPVLFVYDLDDTDGEPLPYYFKDPFKTVGNPKPRSLNTMIKNCNRDQIQVARVAKSFLNAGRAINPYFRNPNQTADGAIKIYIEINDTFDDAATYATLCHELAHIYLGHLGNDKDNWWPDRRYLTKEQVELEAEVASYLVCSRAGLETRSAEYLSLYLRNEKDLEVISIDWIVKVAGLIERMSEKKLPDRKR